MTFYCVVRDSPATAISDLNPSLDTTQQAEAFKPILHDNRSITG
jgi:hypothetical protein